METHHQNPDRTVAALIHLSAFSKYFIPLGNFIFPLILWTARKQDSFVDHHGKQALNFQISIFLYFVILVCIGIAGAVTLGMELTIRDPFIISDSMIRIARVTEALPFLILLGVVGTLLLGLFIYEIIAVISATIKASEGQFYKYPLTINFITSSEIEDHHHQSKNEQFNNTQNPRQ